MVSKAWGAPLNSTGSPWASPLCCGGTDLGKAQPGSPGQFSPQGATFGIPDLLPLRRFSFVIPFIHDEIISGYQWAITTPVPLIGHSNPSKCYWKLGLCLWLHKLAQQVVLKKAHRWTTLHLKLDSSIQSKVTDLCRMFSVKHCLSGINNGNNSNAY